MKSNHKTLLKAAREGRKVTVRVTHGTFTVPASEALDFYKMLGRGEEFEIISIHQHHTREERRRLLREMDKLSENIQEV